MHTNIHTQLRGHAAAVLDLLGIDPAALHRHIRCPLPDHADRRPSFRVDEQANRYYCTCNPRGGSLVDLVINMHVAGDFKSAVRFLRQHLKLDSRVTVFGAQPAILLPAPGSLAGVSPADPWAPLQQRDTPPLPDINPFDEYLKRCIPAYQHPYARKKRIAPVGAFLDPVTGNLVLPVHDADDEIRGIQLISAAGEKWFAEGTALRGHGLLLGSVHDARGLGGCEGWATGVTLYSLLGLPMLVAFTANNLLAAARPYHAMGIPLVFFGDRDPNGIGQRYARAAASELNAAVRLPPERTGETDFNDVYVRKMTATQEGSQHV